MSELVDVVDMLLGRFDWNRLSGRGLVFSRELAGAVAMADLSLIQGLRHTTRDCDLSEPWCDAAVLHAAGRRGDPAVVDVIVERLAAGPLSEEVKAICYAAAKAGHEHILAHVQATVGEITHYNYPRQLMEMAAGGGHVHVLDWICANVCKYTRRTRPYKEAPWHVDAVANVAAYCCHIDVLAWAFAQGVLPSAIRDWMVGVPAERKAATCEWLEAHWLVPDTVDNAWSQPPR